MTVVDTAVRNAMLLGAPVIRSVAWYAVACVALCRFGSVGLTCNNFQKRRRTSFPSKVGKFCFCMDPNIRISNEQPRLIGLVSSTIVCSQPSCLRPLQCTTSCNSALINKRQKLLSFHACVVHCISLPYLVPCLWGLVSLVAYVVVV